MFGNFFQHYVTSHQNEGIISFIKYCHKYIQKSLETEYSTLKTLFYNAEGLLVLKPTEIYLNVNV